MRGKRWWRQVRPSKNFPDQPHSGWMCSRWVEVVPSNIYMYKYISSGPLVRQVKISEWWWVLASHLLRWARWSRWYDPRLLPSAPGISASLLCTVILLSNSVMINLRHTNSWLKLVGKAASIFCDFCRNFSDDVWSENTRAQSIPGGGAWAYCQYAVPSVRYN